MRTLKINHAAVWILVLIHQVIGGIWFSPFLFANKWIELVGKPMSDFENVNFLPYAFSIINAIVMNYSMAWLFKQLHVENFAKGMMYAFIFWFAFLFVEIITFNAFELRPVGLALIDSGKSLVTFLISGIILGSWKKYVTDKIPVSDDASKI